MPRPLARYLATLALAVAWLAAPVRAAAAGQAFAPVRATSPFALDPALSDPRWATARFATGFVNLGTRVQAREQTESALFYDDTNLYVAFRAQQDAPLVATQKTNDVGFGVDDFVGFGIDTGGNAEQVYFFETTPAGTRYQQANESVRYTPIWSAAAIKTATGWNAMMIIPLKILKISGNGRQPWKVNFVRATVGAAEHDSWVFAGLMVDATVPNWPAFPDARYWPAAGDVVLAHAASKPRPRGEVYTLGSLGADRRTFIDPDGTVTERNPRAAGIDLSYPITPTISVVGAFDPDFSNVEIDQQTIVPQQLQRNLTEYRPFFAQGAPFINANRDGYEWNLPKDVLFYSPSIGAFDQGIKIEGTDGPRSLGVLETSGGNAADGTAFDDTAFGFLHRRSSNTLALWFDGVLARHSIGDDDSFELGGYGRSLASGLVYSLQYGRDFGTFVPNPADAQAMRAFVDIQKPGFEGAVSYQDIGPEYHPLDGFTNLADIRGPDAFFDWVKTLPSGSPVKNVELFFNADRWLDRDNAVHASDFDLFLQVRTNHSQRYAFGDSDGTLRTYGGDVYSGFPNGYAGALTQPYATKDFEIHLGEATPHSLDMSYVFGPFGKFYLDQLATTVSTQLGGGRSLSFDYDGTRERDYVGPSDGQWLRRLSLAFPLGAGGSGSIAYRVISGQGGFAAPGHNLAVGIQKRFRNDNELFVDYGTPSAVKTLRRWIVKYLMRFGGGV